MSDSRTRSMPPASCKWGYTAEDMERYWGARRGERHPLWDQLRGQTGVICEGEDCDVAHGPVSYVGDVQEWVEGKPVSDW